MKYTLPEPKKNTSYEDKIEPSCDYDDDYRRRVRIPVNAELLKLLPIGTKVEIVLTGEITEAESDKNSGGATATLYTKTVEVDSKNEFEELAEDE